MADKNIAIIRKLVRYIDKIQRYCGDRDFFAFMADSILAEACVLNLSQMGELTRNLDDNFKNTHSYVPWNSIYNLRNRIVHDYDGVDFEIIWDIIHGDLDKLKQQLLMIE